MPNVLRSLLCTLLLTHTIHVRAAEEPLPNPILNPDTPWVFSGFSVNVPADEGWVSFFRTGNTAALGKNSDDATHVYGINVLAAPISETVNSAEELVAQLNKNRPILIDLEEYSITQRKESPKQINGYWCSQYSIKADAKKDQQFSHLYIQGISCANPINPRQLVDIGVSDLTGADSMALQLFPVADRMMNSIKFLPRISKQQSEEVGKFISSNDMQGALSMLQPRAESGDSRAAFLLADIYINAKDLKDYRAARKWLELSAAQGERDALYQMGVMYDKALGVERNLEQAVKWFKLAADQRDAQAQLNLGILHDPRADGIAKDIQVAAQWLVLAANNGSQRAKHLLEKQYKRKTESAPDAR